MKSVKGYIGDAFFKTVKKTIPFFENHSIADIRLFFKHYILGRSYVKFYAALMDNIIEEDENWGVGITKKGQLDYLINQQGLKEDMSFLDYGCGAVNAGVYFIQYLNKGKYVGVDISEKVIISGKQRLSSESLDQKEPQLIHIEDGSVKVLGEKKFDVIWTQSVFTHLPESEIEKIIKNLLPFMHKKSTFYATCHLLESGSKFVNVKDFAQSLGFYESLALKYGLKAEQMTDWIHPQEETISDANKNGLIKMTFQ